MEHEVFDEGSDQFETVGASTFYAAIDRTGVKAESESDQTLIDSLNKKDDYIIKFENFEI